MRVTEELPRNAGQVASLTSGEEGNEAPLAREIGRFVIQILIIAIIFAITFFIVGITTVYKGRAAQTVTFAVSILVAFVPEGLPSVVTLLLSIAAKRMSEEGVLVKDLEGVETLGSLTLLATDKTGTLTRNMMTVGATKVVCDAPELISTSYRLRISGMAPKCSPHTSPITRVTWLHSL